MRFLLSWLLFVVLLLGLPLDAFAYTQGTVYYSPIFTEGGRRCQWYWYTETAVTTTSDALVPIFIDDGAIVVFHQDRTAGDAATLLPLVGLEAGFTAGTIPHIATATAAADPIYEADDEVPFYAPLKRLYIRPAPNTGTNNAVSTMLKICAGSR